MRGAWIVAVALCTLGQTKWHLPVTIEALQDVSAHGYDTPSLRPASLDVGRDESFIIKKGQRFLMVKIGQEGGCRIEFEKKQYEVTSCPWLDGFRDHQEGIFKVVSGGEISSH